MLAHLMGIRPWEVDLLTVQQLDDAIRDIDAYIQQQTTPASSSRADLPGPSEEVVVRV